MPHKYDKPQKYAVLRKSSSLAELLIWDFSDYWKEGWYKTIATGEPANIDNICRDLNNQEKKVTEDA